MSLAYLPERSFEVGGVILGVSLAIQGIATIALPDGFIRSARGGGDENTPVTAGRLRMARAWGVVMIAAAAAIVVAGFVIDPEPPGGFPDSVDEWGGTDGKIATAVWGFFLALITVVNLVRGFRRAGRDRH